MESVVCFPLNVVENDHGLVMDCIISGQRSTVIFQERKWIRVHDHHKDTIMTLCNEYHTLKSVSSGTIDVVFDSHHQYDAFPKYMFGVVEESKSPEIKLGRSYRCGDIKSHPPNIIVCKSLEDCHIKKSDLKVCYHFANEGIVNDHIVDCSIQSFINETRPEIIVTYDEYFHVNGCAVARLIDYPIHHLFNIHDMSVKKLYKLWKMFDLLNYHNSETKNFTYFNGIYLNVSFTTDDVPTMFSYDKWCMIHSSDPLFMSCYILDGDYLAYDGKYFHSFGKGRLAKPWCRFFRMYVCHLLSGMEYKHSVSDFVIERNISLDEIMWNSDSFYRELKSKGFKGGKVKYIITDKGNTCDIENVELEDINVDYYKMLLR